MTHVKSLYVEVLRDEHEGLRARIAELEAQAGDGTSSNKYRAELYDEVWQTARDMGYGNVIGALQELAALKTQPSGAVLPERQSRKEAFECGGVAQEQFVTGWNACLDEVARLNPCRAQSVPDGYVMVPVDPTPEMLDRYPFNVSAVTSEPMDKEDLRVVYQAMLAAAPSAKKEG